MALAIYFVPFELLTAYIVACIIHEFSHIVALRINGVKIFSFQLELKGLVIEHENIDRASIELACILAGPAGGLVFAYFCSMFSRVISSQWFEICSAISLILSIFNLLPCKPLDGGKALGCMTGMIFPPKTSNTVSTVIGLVVSFLFLISGLYVFYCGYGYGVAAAGVCIVINILFEEGIVKINGLR